MTSSKNNQMAEGTRQPSLQRRAEGWKHHPTQHPHFGGDHCRLLWYDFWSRLGLLLFLCCCLIVAFVLFYRLCHHLPHDDHRHHHDNIKVQCPISSHNDKEKNSFGKNTKYKTSNMASFNFQWSQNISTRADKFFPFSVRNQQNKPNIHPPKAIQEVSDFTFGESDTTESHTMEPDEYHHSTIATAATDNIIKNILIEWKLDNGNRDFVERNDAGDVGQRQGGIKRHPTMDLKGTAETILPSTHPLLPTNNAGGATKTAVTHPLEQLATFRLAKLPEVQSKAQQHQDQQKGAEKYKEMVPEDERVPEPVPMASPECITIVETLSLQDCAAMPEQSLESLQILFDSLPSDGLDGNALTTSESSSSLPSFLSWSLEAEAVPEQKEDDFDSMFVQEDQNAGSIFDTTIPNKNDDKGGNNGESLPIIASLNGSKMKRIEKVHQRVHDDHNLVELKDECTVGGHLASDTVVSLSSIAEAYLENGCGEKVGTQRGHEESGDASTVDRDVVKSSVSHTRKEEDAKEDVRMTNVASVPSPSVPNIRSYQNDQWNERFQELLEYHKAYGRTDVPYQWSKNKRLSQWVKRQRHQYKLKCNNEHSNLTDEREDLLNSLGFVWDSRNFNWEEKFAELCQFKQAFGHVKVTKKLTKHRSLCVWLKRQRGFCREFLSHSSSSSSSTSNGDEGLHGMTNERMSKLMDLGVKLNLGRTREKRMQSR